MVFHWRHQHTLNERMPVKRVMCRLCGLSHRVGHPSAFLRHPEKRNWTATPLVRCRVEGDTRLSSHARWMSPCGRSASTDLRIIYHFALWVKWFVVLVESSTRHVVIPKLTQPNFPAIIFSSFCPNNERYGVLRPRNSVNLWRNWSCEDVTLLREKQDTPRETKKGKHLSHIVSIFLIVTLYFIYLLGLSNIVSTG